MAEENTPITEDEASLADILSAPKRRKFVIAYVDNGGNGTQAALSSGYPEKSAASQASRMLKDEKVQRAIRRYSQCKAAVAGENRDTILDRMINRARFDIRDYFETVPILDQNGQHRLGAGNIPLVTEELKPMNQLTREQAARIKKLSWNQHGPVIEFHDPAAADRDLANLLGYTKEDDSSLTAEDAAALIAASLAKMDELDHSSSAS
jgi:hypothetical protein